MTALRADGTSYPKGICSAALHCGTPSPTSGSPYPSVGRDPCVPPRHTYFRRGTRAPPYRAQAVSGRTESSAPTAGQGAVRNGTSYPKGICSAALHCGTPFPTSGSPYPSVGRDPCVPPHNMHVFLPAGHAGPALQGTGRIRADRVVRPYDGVPCIRQADATKSRRARRAFTSWGACALISLYLPPDMCWRRGSGRRSCSRPCRGRGAG